MKPDEPILFKLIKSLDKNEKGYFKKQATPFGKNHAQNYLLLFDAIDRQTSYDEAVLKKQFATSLGASGFSQAKAYLLENIFKSMVSYNHGSSPTDKIEQLLAAGIVLFNKNLDKEAAQYLTKAKAMAYKIEDHRLVLQVIQWEKMILGLNVNDTFLEAINGLLEEEQQCTRQISMMAELQKVYYAVFYIIKKERNLSGEAQLQKLKELMQTPILQEQSYLQWTKGRVAYHNIHLFYYDLTGEYDKGLHHSREILRTWEESPPQAGENLSKYLSCIQNHINLCWRLNEPNEMLPQLQAIKTLKPKTDLMKLRVFEVYHHCEMAYYSTSMKLEEYEPQMDAFINDLETYKAKIRASYYWVSVYNISGFYLFLGKFGKALELLNKLMPGNDDYDMLKDSKRVILITNLILHYELGNMEALPHYTRAAQRALKNQNCGELELSFMRFMKKLLSTPLSLRKEVFADYLQQTEALEKQTGLGAITKMFDWKVWLQSQIQKKRMLDLMREDVKEVV